MVSLLEPSSVGASWHFPNGTAVSFTLGADCFFQIEAGLSLVHNLIGSNNAVDSMAAPMELHMYMGIYQRGGGTYAVK